MFDPSKAIKKMLGPGINVPKFGPRSPTDSDGDGINDIMDCQPKNMFRQDGFNYRPYALIATGGYDPYLDQIKDNGKILTYGEDHEGAFWSDSRGNSFRYISKKEDKYMEKLLEPFKKYRHSIKGKFKRILVMNDGSVKVKLLDLKKLSDGTSVAYGMDGM